MSIHPLANKAQIIEALARTPTKNAAERRLGYSGKARGGAIRRRLRQHGLTSRWHGDVLVITDSKAAIALKETP